MNLLSFRLARIEWDPFGPMGPEKRVGRLEADKSARYLFFLT